MRFLLALILMAPAFAQEPPAQATPPAKPDEKTAAAPAQTETKTEAAPAEKAAESPAPSTESWINGSIDFGYRWLTNVNGNFQQYRSVVNLGEGPKLFGVDLTIQDPKKRLFDRLDARAYGWGGDPYSTAHVEMRKAKVYDLNVDYRNIAYFNAVPSFANPSAPQGFDEQSFDLHRRNVSATLDFNPGGHILPYLAFERNSGYGHGIETFVNESSNEYPVNTLFRDSTDNFRGGLRVEFNRFHITVEQGGTRFKDDDQALDRINELGDRTTPLFGQTLQLTGLNQAYGIRGTSTYTKFLGTLHATSNMDFYAQVLYSQPKTDVNFNELAAGNFAQINSLLFYSNQITVGTGAANQPHTTANIGYEIRLFHNHLRFLYSGMTDRYHDDASPFVIQSFTGFSTAAGATPVPTVATALNYGQKVNYNQQQFDLVYDLGSKITLRGGARVVTGDATVLAGQLSQTGDLVSGKLNRIVGLGGLTYRASQKLTVNLDYEGASSDNIYFRTSLNNYSKGRARAKYQFNQALGLQARFTVLDNQNPDPSIKYDFRSRDNAISLFWTPKGGKLVSLMGEYDRSTLQSSISYLGLFLSPQTSLYRDNAHSATAALNLTLPGLVPAKLTVGGSLFISNGSRSTQYYQPLARLSLPIGKHVYWNTDWQYYGYGEQMYLFEAFRTHVFQTGLRLTK
ncbi:MAG TPA: hypothetical protein VG456_24715 [Candidatus Sulfopaludibacter sp.]|jgi:hypothetical protein|nr:hypothetical protein [Candidatus Sulfopaludibacter sp.]